MEADLHAGGLILRRESDDGDRWLLLKARKHGEWGFPKGHLHRDESLLAGALRECAEECGIALVAIEGEPFLLNYRIPDGRSKQVAYFPARTRQEDYTLSPEHVAGAWMDADATRRTLLHPTLRQLFDAYHTQRPQ